MFTYTSNSSPENIEAFWRLASVFPRIFGCHTDTKRPRQGRSWKTSAIVRPYQVDGYLRGANLMPAIDVGAAGLFVIDLDVGHAEGVDGLAAIETLSHEHGETWEGFPVVRTGSGGVHIYCRQPAWREPLGNGEGALPDGINVRGVGGYVIAVGAVRADRKRYTPIEGTPCVLESYPLGLIPEVPRWFIEILETLPVRPDIPHRYPSADSLGGERKPCSDARGRAYATNVLSYGYDELSGAGVGRRNRCLYFYSRRMGEFAARGWITEHEAFEMFWEACLVNDYIRDDGKHAFVKTFSSGFEKGLTQPANDPVNRPIKVDPEFEARIAPFIAESRQLLANQLGK